MYLQQTQQPPAPTVLGNIPHEHTTAQQAGQSQQPNIQPQYVPMPPGPVRPSNTLLRDDR
jgi:hypothetical protein